MATQQITVTLPELHAGQRDILLHPARFKVVCCGRRWGKTLLSAVMALAEALHGGRVWLVSPTYKQGLEAWEYLKLISASLPHNKNETELINRYDSGGSVQVRTADDPDKLRGAGLDFIVLDEAAELKPATWDQVLRPALADRRGRALFISTPKHFNHFWEWYQLGESREHDEWMSWNFPTWTNPFIPADEIDAAKRDMLPEDWDQEFGASFTAVGGAIFRRLSAERQRFLRPLPSGVEFRRTGVGLDWGTTKDHQAAVVCACRTPGGSVWVRSCWLSSSGSDAEWFAEASRCRRDYAASVARVDRSQSSARDRLRALGYQDAETGVADVDARIGAYQGLIIPESPNIYFDSTGPGVVEYFNDLCSYHRDREGDVVEERDDSVDAGGYIIHALTQREMRPPNYAVRTPIKTSERTSRYGSLRARGA